MTTDNNNQSGAPGKVDMSKVALELAKETGFFCGDDDRFKKWEKAFIKKFYETIGLSDIPDEFLTFSKFIDAYSGVLVKSVQNDLAIMNLTKRLAMFKLSENIAATSDKPVAPETEETPENAPEVLPTFVPPTK